MTRETQFTASVVLLLLGCLFALYLVFPYFSHGYNPAGDDCIHIAYCLELKTIALEKHKLFGWSYLYGVGAPIFIFRPPGFYLGVVILHLLSGGLIPILLAHKLVTALALVLYPLALYYLLYKFDFPPLAAGIASLLALAPISTWGHTIDAYFDLGLAKQTLAILIFPFFLGKLHGILSRRESAFPGALLFAAMFLNHPYMALSAVLCAGVYLVVFLCAFSLRKTLLAAIRCARVLLFGSLMASVWLVPFYSSPEIHPSKGYGAGWRHGFTVTAETASATLKHFWRGSLFDRSRGDTFGKGSAWAWRDNSAGGRWPALTAACLIGLAAFALGLRCFRNLFFLVSFLFSLLVFFGPDDVPLLRLIPFQEQFQYIHWIPIPEMFAVAAAGAGLFFAISLAGLLLRKGLEKIRFFRRFSWLEGAAFGAVAVPLLAVFIFPVWRDRLVWAGKRIHNRSFETAGASQSAWSLKFPINRAFQECADYLRAFPPEQRLYASPVSGHVGMEIFYFTLAPPLVGHTDVISPLFAGLKGGWNRVIGSTFRKTLWKSRNLLDLLNVHFIMYHRQNQDRYQPLPAFTEEVVANDYWRLHRVISDSTLFQFTARQPILTSLSPLDWEETIQDWGDYYRDLEDTRGAIFLVNVEPGRLLEEVGENGDRYAGLLLTASSVDNHPGWQETIREFQAAGRRLFMVGKNEGQPETEFSEMIADLGLDPASTSDLGREAAVTPLREEREYHSARVETDREGWLIFKMAFYRGWRASLDGKEVPTYCLSPGYNAIRVPSGSHRVEFRYAGANRAWLGNAISLTALLVGFIGWRVGRRRAGKR